jgi:hypothetical protein
VTKYRVWAKVRPDSTVMWLPVSTLFEKREDADEWARYLNTEGRVEEEDED